MIPRTPGDTEPVARAPYNPEVSGDRRRAPPSGNAWLAPAFLVGALLTTGGFVWNVATSARDLKYVTDRVEENRSAAAASRTDDLKNAAANRADDMRLLAGQLADLRREVESRRRDDDSLNSKRADYLQALDNRVSRVEQQVCYALIGKPGACK